MNVTYRGDFLWRREIGESETHSGLKDAESILKPLRGPFLSITQLH
jgi:hypothetical protein